MNKKLEETKEAIYALFKENAELIENPIEHGDSLVDGSFYQVYRGDIESFLEDFAEQVWNAALTACMESLPKERIGEETDGFPYESLPWNLYRTEALTAIDSLKT